MLSKSSSPPQQRSKLFSWSSVDSNNSELNYYDGWHNLKNLIMVLDKEKYADSCNSINTTMLDVIKTQIDDSPTYCILYLLFEKALRDILTKSFPVSVCLLNSLKSSYKHNTNDIIEVCMNNCVDILEKKLQLVLALSGTDIGVIYLLFSIYKQDSLTTKFSPTASKIIQIIKYTKEYLNKVQYDEQFVNEVLAIYLYGLIIFSIDCELSCSEINFIKVYIRKLYLLKAQSFSLLGRTMIIDIIEQMHKNKAHVQLYFGIYQHILSSKRTFLLRDVKSFLNLHEYPLVSEDNKLSNYQDPTEVFSHSLASSSDNISEVSSTMENVITKNDSACSFSNKQILSTEYDSSTEQFLSPKQILSPEQILSNEQILCTEQFFSTDQIISTEQVLSNDQVLSTEPILSTEEILSTEQIDKSILNELISLSLSDSDKVNDRWEKCFSDFPNKKHITNIIEIEERFCSSVQGYEGMVVRELERKSGAVIKMCKESFQVISRPDTSSLTAHKLITGALGIPAQKPIIELQRQKLNEAKIKLQNQEEVTLTRRIKISGSVENVEKAKKLIYDICESSVTLSLALDLTVDEILEYSIKLKGIEVLLNVYMEINEQADNSVVITICGELKCCQDAKKLILEEVGTFRTQYGNLFVVPSVLMTVCGNQDGLEHLVDSVSEISGGKVTILPVLPKCMLFASGSNKEINETVHIFQKLCIELLCCLNSKVDDVIKIEFCVEDLIIYISKIFGENSFNEKNPTLMSKYLKDDKQEGKKSERLIYSREELKAYEHCKCAENFPESLYKLDFELAAIVIKKDYLDNTIKSMIVFGDCKTNNKENCILKKDDTEKHKNIVTSEKTNSETFCVAAKYNFAIPNVASEKTSQDVFKVACGITSSYRVGSLNKFYGNWRISAINNVLSDRSHDSKISNSLFSRTSKTDFDQFCVGRKSTFENFSCSNVKLASEEVVEIISCSSTKNSNIYPTKVLVEPSVSLQYIGTPFKGCFSFGNNNPVLNKNTTRQFQF